MVLGLSSLNEESMVTMAAQLRVVRDHHRVFDRLTSVYQGS